MFKGTGGKAGGLRTGYSVRKRRFLPVQLLLPFQSFNPRGTLNWIGLCGAGSKHWGMFGSTLALYPLDASSTPLSQCVSACGLAFSGHVTVMNRSPRAAGNWGPERCADGIGQPEQEKKIISSKGARGTAARKRQQGE